MSMSTFGDRLLTAVQEKGPLCVGVDPGRRTLEAWGLADSPEGARSFGLTMVEAAAGRVPVVKPQSAYFERFGWEGVRVLSDIVQAARENGLLVLLDAKRGDIGATNDAYAEAYLTPTSPLQVDALTVTAYTGLEALAPLYQAAKRCGTGLFVLTRSSNPEGATLQDAVTASGATVADDLLAGLASINSERSVGSIGCVFGATSAPDRVRLDAVNAFVLAPGLGAQGATADDLALRFRGCRYVLPSASRVISSAGPDPRALGDRVRRLSDECSAALEQGSRA
jgi:orotidine-5'-phosphate decarboxylase